MIVIFWAALIFLVIYNATLAIGCWREERALSLSACINLAVAVTTVTTAFMMAVR